MKTFTEDELKEFDGSEEGKPVYFAYKGKVYDATDHPLFVDGMHFEHAAGMDLTEDMEDAPHEEAVLDELTVVGDYKD